MKAPRKKVHWKLKPSVKKALSILLLIALLILISLVVMKITHYSDEDLRNATMYVQYTELNVRDEPGTGNVVGELHRGNTVELTGAIHEFLGGDSDGRWYEIQWTDGSTAWVIGDALLSPMTYRDMFGS